MDAYRYKNGWLSGIVFSFCLSFLLIACSNNNAKGDKADSSQTAGREISGPGEKECYNYIVNGDTIVLTIKWLDTSRFTGSMVYRLREKDGNIGTLEGSRKDSILLAEYRFSAEGTISTREVAFKKIADYIVEGFGDVTPDSSGFRFTHPDSLTFDLNKKLHRVHCL